MLTDWTHWLFSLHRDQLLLFLLGLLLTDVVMPTISGGELAGRVRAIEPDVKVLFMSGYSSELVAQHGAVQRGTRVLEKPFTRRALLSQIRFALQN